MTSDVIVFGGVDSIRFGRLVGGNGILVGDRFTSSMDVRGEPPGGYGIAVGNTIGGVPS